MSAQFTPTPDPTEPVPMRRSPWERLLGPMSRIVLISALMTAGGLWAYHLAFVPSASVAVVDVASVIEASEMKATEMLTKTAVTDADRGNAYDLMKSIGPRLNTLIESIQKTCRCTVFIKGAVAAGDVTDYTDQVKVALQLDKVDVAAVNEQMHHALTDGIAPKAK